MDDFVKLPLMYQEIGDQTAQDFAPIVYGYEECARNKPAIYRDRTWYVLHIVIAGKGTLVTGDGHRIPLEKNTCFLLEPHSTITYMQNPDDPWTYYWVEYSGILARELTASIGFRDGILPVAEQDVAFFSGIFDEIFDPRERCSHTNAENTRVTGQFLRLFARLTDRYPPVDRNRHLGKKYQRIMPIIEFLSKNYMSPDVNIGTIEKMFFYNQSYLARLFREVTGTTPSKYLIDLRMKRAAELLGNGGFTVLQIAQSLGYKNQFYFSQQFKQYYHVCPSKYRKPEDQ